MKASLKMVIIVFIMFLFIDVKAAGSFSCKYQKDSNNVSVTISKNDQSSTPQVNSGLSGYAASFENVNSIKSINDCPSVVYYNCNNNICNFKSYYWSDANSGMSGSLSLNSVGSQGKNFGIGRSISSYFNGVSGIGGCSGYFGSANDKGSLMYILKYQIFRPIKILVPIIFLLLTTIDFSKVVFDNAKDSMGKAKSNFAKRGIVSLIIFFAPYLLSLLLTLIDNGVIKSCLNNF